MGETKVDSESVASNAAGFQENADTLQQRREQICTLRVQLRQNEQTIVSVLQRVESAEAFVHLMVPRQFRQQSMTWLLQPDTAVACAQADPYVTAFVQDLTTYAALGGMRESLNNLLNNNRRFGMVLDLILAAMPLVETKTHQMAEGCVGMHVMQCNQLLHQVEGALETFPRSRQHWSRRFTGPVA